MCLAGIPIVGSVLGVLGAHTVWGWSLMASIILMFGWLIIFGMVVLLTMSDSFDYAANFYSDWFSWKLKRKRLSFLGAVFFGNIFVYGMMFLSDRLFAQWAVMFIICFAFYGLLICQ